MVPTSTSACIKYQRLHVLRAKVNFKLIFFSKIEEMPTLLSDLINCPKCDRKFQFPVVYKFHMENSHPPIFVTPVPPAFENDNSQNLKDENLKTISIKEEILTDKKLTEALTNQLMAIEKKEQATSYTQNQQDMTNFAQDFTVKDIQDEQKMVTNLESQNSHKNSKRCKICSKSFEHLTRHMDKVHIKNLKCQLCEKSFGCKTNLQQHIDGVHADEKKFVCQECKKCFFLKVHLRTHVRMVHENVRPYKCSLCKLSFHLKKGLLLHIKFVHEKPFKCEMCGGSWGSESLLKQHMITCHNQSNRIVCQTCRYTFSRKKTLKKHLKKMHNITVEVQNILNVKTGPVPTMKCEYCENMYMSSRGVHLHQAREHKDLWLSSKNCKICHKSFQTVHYAALHVKLVHEDTRPFECKICNKKFKLKFTLKVHVNAVHKKIKRFGCFNCKDRFNSAIARDKHIFICAIKSNSEIKTGIEIDYVEDDENRK